MILLAKEQWIELSSPEEEFVNFMIGFFQLTIDKLKWWNQCSKS
tara:strand:- start:392 stop:523 length:132 start_codon:yes stop_codon:yes gene_type:complete